MPQNKLNIYLYFPTGSNLDDHKITVLSAAPEANSLPFLAVSKQKIFSLCPKNKISLYKFKHYSYS